MENKNIIDWLFRFFKGMLIGTGAILPGVSGGALAAVFGIYDKLISFIAHLNVKFKKNFLYFLPVGIGGVLGIFLLSFALSYFFEKAETYISWFFIGCIIGILPALFKQASKFGRKPKHIVIMIVTAILSFIFLYNMQNLISGSVPQNFFTWLMAGAIMALGLIVPGLSPSNFLLYLGMYKPMTDGISNFDLSVIIPIVISAVATIILFSKLMDYIFNRAYTVLRHFIIGIVLSSTIMIIPMDYNYLNIGTLLCVATFLIGVALGAWMSKLEEKYKPT